MPRTTPSSRTPCLIATLLAGVAGQAWADPQWVSLDGSPAGTPPTVALNGQQSTLNDSVVDVTIHGFWREVIAREGQNWTHVRLPDAGHAAFRTGRLLGEGRPELPTILVQAVMPSTAQTISPTVDVLATTNFPGTLIFPAQPDVLERPNGQVDLPPFTVDNAAYSNATPYPGVAARTVAEPRTFRRIESQAINIHPFRFTGSEQLLVVNSRLRVRLHHPGQAANTRTISRRSAAWGGEGIINWEVAPYHVNRISYEGCFLFVTPSRYRAAIDPLVDQKRERGFRVTVIETESLASVTPTNIFAAITDWYNNCSDQSDAYAILVGDDGELPIYQSSITPDGDFRYSDVDLDTVPDIGLGRLSVDDETDCATQVAKILEYEDSPPPTTFYDKVELAAHRWADDEYPLSYIDAMTEVAEYPWYINGPIFTSRFGNAPDGTITNVDADIEAGRNVVMYRGHGSSGSWSSWDYNSMSLSSSLIPSILNSPETPIVLNVCCSNASIDTSDDTIAEEWMENGPGGAVASYGASQASYRTPNNEFAKEFFKFLYGDDDPSISDVLASAWLTASYTLNDSSAALENRYMYLLLGDPELRVWRDNPNPFVISSDLRVFPWHSRFSVQVRNSAGLPIPGVVVSGFKRGELQNTAYTGADGTASLVVDGLDGGGDLVLRVWDERGRFRDVRRTIPIACPADFDEDGAVDFFDYDAFVVCFEGGACPPGRTADFDGDGTTDFFDYDAFVVAFETPC